MEKCSNCGQDLVGLDKLFRSMTEFDLMRRTAGGELDRLAKESQQDALSHLLLVCAQNVLKITNIILTLIILN